MRSTLQRIYIWLACLLIAVAAFSLPFGEGTFAVFRVTFLFALPVWILYLPIVIALRDAGGARILVLLFSGLLIGPVCLFFVGLFQQIGGGDPHMVWQGNGLDFGVLPMMTPAAIVGVLAAGLYGIALKIVESRSSPSET